MKIYRIHNYRFFVIAICFLLINQAYSLDVKAADQEPPKVCDVVAVVFSTVICRESLESQNMSMTAPTETYGQQDDKQTLEGALLQEIWQRSLYHRYPEAKLLPTTEDTSAYARYMHNNAVSAYEADKLMAAHLKDAIDSGAYKPETVQKMMRLHEMLETSITLQDKKKTHTETIPEDFKFITAEAEQQFARNLLTLWYQDKQLYEEYGGQLVLSDNIIIPVDAHLSFLGYIMDESGLIIQDETYQNILQQYQQDLMFLAKAPLPSEDPAYKHYYSDPYWYMSQTAEAKNLGKLDKWLERNKIEGVKDE